MSFKRAGILKLSIHGLLLVLQSKMEIVSNIMGMYGGIKCLPYRSIIVKIYLEHQVGIFETVGKSTEIT